MDAAARYSLNELARLSGVEARTIRSWIQQGLIPGPETRGRGASYGEEALTRVLAVRAMREHYGMPLQAIRQELLLADEERIAVYARGASAEGGTRSETNAGPAGLEPAPAGSTAAEYLQALRDVGVFGGRVAHEHEQSADRAGASESDHRRATSRRDLQRSAPPPGSDSPVLERPGTGPSSLDRLAAHLESAVPGRAVPRRTRGDIRLVLPVTPDIELVVRGALKSDEIAPLERIADALRELLIGGSGRDQ